MKRVTEESRLVIHKPLCVQVMQKRNRGKKFVGSGTITEVQQN